ncbi:MAG: hypothetical protein NVSMB9_06560 [Isosphaeraceae bacterium]
MAGGSAGADVLNQLKTLSRLGVVGDLSDENLLRRALTARNGIEEAAFTVLVERHGPMVWRVCQQVLDDSHESEDAFQATFLVLARKAGSIREAGSLASWLHGVARRVAARARADAVQRRAHERRGAAEKSTVAPDETGEREPWRELHEEIDRLPRRYREPVVLCYLEGLSTEAAAHRLGCPPGTIYSRLSRARERLRDRLARRGLASAPVVARLTPGPSAAVSEHLGALTGSLVSRTVQLTLGNLSTAGAVPASVLSLSSGVLHAMTLAKLKTAILTLFAAALFGLAGVGVHAYQERDGTEKPAPSPAPHTTTPLEAKFDPAPKPSQTSRRPTLPATDPFLPQTPPTVNPTSIQELAAQLEMAREKLKIAERMRGLRGGGTVSASEFAEAEGQVRILEGRALGQSQQLEDELELLEVRLDVKKAELEGASALFLSADTKLTWYKKMKESGSIPIEASGEAEVDFVREKSLRALRNAEVHEVEVRIRQVKRRLRTLAPLLKPTEPASKVRTEDTKPAPPPAVTVPPGS